MPMAVSFRSGQPTGVRPNAIKLVCHIPYDSMPSPRRAGQAKDGHHLPPGDYHLTAGDEAPDHRGQLAHQACLSPALRGLNLMALALDQVATAEKSNGITAIPKLLEINGCIVTL